MFDNENDNSHFRVNATVTGNLASNNTSKSLDINKRNSNTTQILWISFRSNSYESTLDPQLTDLYKTQYILSKTSIEKAIQFYKPQLLCFDFDYPDQIGLNTIKKTRQSHPSLPFLMFTTDHSTKLAIWALRLRTWDYFIKPVAVEEVTNSIDAILNKCTEHSVGRKRDNLMPQPSVPSGSRPYRTKVCGASTDSATSYVKQHLDEKISLDQIANHCGMSKSHFSRTFKNQHSVTFQEFLCQQRIKKAVDLLKGSDCMVTQVAFAVGFTDLSYFTRTFQKFVGLGPSDFRKAAIPKH